MTFLIGLGYLIITISVGGYVYYWSGLFKKMGVVTLEEINEGLEENEEPASKNELKWTQRIGTVLFIIVGFYLWSFIGATVGHITAMITEHFILKWIVYLFMYFLCLRFPFGVLNRTIKETYMIGAMPEKLLFVIGIILFYVLGIGYIEYLPNIWTWHLE